MVKGLKKRSKDGVEWMEEENHAIKIDNKTGELMERSDNMED